MNTMGGTTMGATTMDVDTFDPAAEALRSELASVEAERGRLAAELERLIKEKLGVGVKAAEEEPKDSPKLKAVDGF